MDFFHPKQSSRPPQKIRQSLSTIFNNSWETSLKEIERERERFSREGEHKVESKNFVTCLKIDKKK